MKAMDGIDLTHLRDVSLFLDRLAGRLDEFYVTNLVYADDVRRLRREAAQLRRVARTLDGAPGTIDDSAPHAVR